MMMVARKSSSLYPIETPIWPAAVPWLAMARRSSALPPAVKSTVSVPVSKLAESASIAVAVPSIVLAPPFSV